MSPTDAILAMMADKGPQKVKEALSRPKALFKGMMKDYLDNEGKPILLDSLESAEAAETDERRMELAARVWSQLTPQERQTLQDRASEIEAEPEDLRRLLDQRI